jgi:hypothetical protein
MEYLFYKAKTAISPRIPGDLTHLSALKGLTVSLHNSRPIQYEIESLNWDNIDHIVLLLRLLLAFLSGVLIEGMRLRQERCIHKRTADTSITI